jgi:hypothetical protein
MVFLISALGAESDASTAKDQMLTAKSQGNPHLIHELFALTIP